MHAHPLVLPLAIESRLGMERIRLADAVGRLHRAADRGRDIAGDASV